MSTDTTQPTSALRAAKAPVGAGAAPLVAQLFALALVALGAVGIEEALARSGAISQPSWIDATLTAVDGIGQDDPIVLVAGIVLAVVAVLLLPVVVLRRPRKAVALESETGVWLRTGDVARIAKGAVEGTDAVTDVEVSSSRRTLKVVATTVASRDRKAEIVGNIERRLADTVGALERAPRVKVSVRNEGS